MSSNGVGESATEPLHSAVAALLELPLTPLSDDEVVGVMREVERSVRVLTAVRHRLLVESSERSLPARFGSKSLKKFLMETLRLASADAGSRVHQALWVGTFHDMGGDALDPQLPWTAKVLAAGEVSADHVRAVAAVMNRVPRGVSGEDREAAEQI
ncbi:DUF222 domain-containing protein, partial [Nocardia mexicana]